jgi:oligopeptide transport system permease protein
VARFILSRLAGSVVVIWVVITLSFLLMRYAPGSPFDAERRLPPAVEANKWVLFGMGEVVSVPVGTVLEVGPGAAIGQDLEEGTLLVRVRPAVARLGDADLPLDPVAGHALEPALAGLVTWDFERATEPVEVRMPRSGQLVTLNVKQGDQLLPGQRAAVVPKSLWRQYLDGLGAYALLDFGVTISSEGARTVSESLLAAIPVSAELGLWALALALFFGIGAGLVAGWKQNSLTDHTVMSLAMIGISVPAMVIGPVLILVFSLTLGWFPPGGWETWQQKVLPSACLSLVYIATFARLTRGGMLEIVSSDYIRTARAKGLAESRIVLRHAFKGAILPTVSFLGPAIARIVTGSVVVEKVFNIPGLGTYFIDPALNRDYPMVIGVVVTYCVVLVLMNLLVDIAYTVLDPRVSYD